MPPRKQAENPDADGEAPRRSARVAAQPKEAEIKPKPVRKASAAKKRAADANEGEDEALAAKKAKADEGTSSMDEGAGSDQPVLASIEIGGILPSLTLQNEKGEDVDIANLAAEQGVVLFLIPKADTPGCTTQACGFRDIYPDFTSVNYAVYCLSADTPTAQSKWQTKKELPYPLLSDPERKLIAALGAADGNKTKRSHFIFEKGGKLVDKKVPVKPADSPKLALEFIKGG